MLLLIVTNFAIGALLYGPALRGAPISDDLITLYIPELQALSWANLRVIFDPGGPVSAALFNFAPVHALLHAFEIQLFGHDLLALHLVNVAFHALTSALLVALFIRTGIPRGAALLGGYLFLAHPACVEAVAWINQLKTTSAMSLAIGALLTHRRRPALATVLFGISLLCKAQAAVALPVLAVLEWTRDAGTSRFPTPRRWLWVAAWAAIFAIFAAFEAPVLVGLGTVERDAFATDSLLHFRTVVAIAGRYLAMAATGYGVSAMHEPPSANSWADPWWLFGLVVLLLLAARTAHAFRQRRSEAAYWVWAAVSYAPVSQVLTFVVMISDRYLYAVLPGLIGALLLAGRDAIEALRDEMLRRRVATGAAVAMGALAAVFGAQVVTERAAVWRHPDSYLVDAALHYPDGATANALRARGLAQRGDGPGATAALRTARERGWTWVGSLFTDAAFNPVREDPSFQALIRELTEETVRNAWALPAPTPAELQSLAQLHRWRGEPARADEALAWLAATLSQKKP